MAHDSGVRRLAVIGDPIGHSLSPKIHTRFLQEAGLDYTYTAIRVKAGEARVFFETAKRENMAGLNVTMPLKEEAFALVDRLDRSAQGGAVNTVVNHGGVFTGYNTDGQGFIRSLGERREHLAGARVVVLGAGGAAKPILAALAQAGVEITLCVRNKEKAAGLVPPERCLFFREAGSACVRADLLVNTTPLGMEGFAGFESLAFVDALPPYALVYDLVYMPRQTALVERARQRGLFARNGMAMLVCQAALAFRLFTGVEPSEATVEEMIGRL